MLQTQTLVGNVFFKHPVCYDFLELKSELVCACASETSLCYVEMKKKKKMESPVRYAHQ